VGHWSAWGSCREPFREPNQTTQEDKPRPSDLALTGPDHGSPTRPVSAVPRVRRRVIRKTTREGVSRFTSQTEPQELTNRRFGPWVTAIHHDQRTNQSSLNLLCQGAGGLWTGLGWATPSGGQALIRSHGPPKGGGVDRSLSGQRRRARQPVYRVRPHQGFMGVQVGA